MYSQIADCPLHTPFSYIHFCRFNECTATYRGVQNLFKLICNKFRHRNAMSKYSMLLRSMVSLLFCSCVKFNEFSSSHPKIVPKSIDIMWKELHKLLLDHWFVYFYTLEFGAPEGKSFKRADSDVQVH